MTENSLKRKTEADTIIRGRTAITEINQRTTEVGAEALRLNRTAEMVKWGLQIKENIKQGKIKIENLPPAGLALLHIVKAIEESNYPNFILKKMFLDEATLEQKGGLNSLGEKTKLLQESRGLLEANGFVLNAGDTRALKVMDLAGVGSFPPQILERALVYAYRGSNPMRPHLGHIIVNEPQLSSRTVKK